jgi:hypothetical protein
MNKGIIIELKKNYAIALNEEGIMDKIVIKDNMKIGEKIFYFEDDIVKAATNKVYRHNNFIKAFGSIAALFLIVFTFFYNMKPEQAFAVVSLDINPSIQIEVNSNQKIIKVEGVNADGKNIDFSDIKNLDFDDGIQKIKEKLVERDYLNNNKEVLVGYAFMENGDNSSYEENLKEVIQETFSTEKVTYVEGDKEAVKEAKTKGISLGRYEASLKVDDEETKSKIDRAPVKDITSSIKNKADVDQWEQEDNSSNTSAADTNKNANVNSGKQSIDRPTINVPSNKPITNSGAGKEKDNNSSAAKPAKNNDELELTPEVPAKNDKNEASTHSNPPKEDTTIIIEPNNGTMENNTTSSKIREDSGKTSSKIDENSVDNNTKN